MESLQEVLINIAEEHASSIMLGFTHLQPAQPVTLGHHLLAYVEMIGRDRGRARDCRLRMNESPLGAAALAGTSFPLDREMTARELGFDRPVKNSMDAVADRDFALEFLSYSAILSVHLIYQALLVGFTGPRAIGLPQVVGGLVTVALTVVMIPRWGLHGAAVACASGYAVLAVTSGIWTTRELKKVGA